MGGGLSDAFRGPVTLVYGTKSKSRKEQLKKFADILSDWSATVDYPVGTKGGKFKVIPDSEWDSSLGSRTNLVLFGTEEENSAAEKLLSKAPVRVRKGGVEFWGQSFKGSGTISTFPNPESPRNLVSVLALPLGGRDLESFAMRLLIVMKSYGGNLDDILGPIGPDIQIYDKKGYPIHAACFDAEWKGIKILY
jgi:hypothetical protein